MIKIGFVQVNYVIGPKSLNGHFLPYSIGLLISYLNKVAQTEFNVTDIVFKRERISDAADRLESADIVGFSTYVWNKMYNYALAQELKRRNPNILTVFGGPEVPISDINLFQKHPYIDLVIENEGEIAFAEILNKFDSKDFRTVPGVVFNNRGFPSRGPAPARIQVLDDIPSPYLTGVFDQLMADNPDVNWSVTLETNRGCPYACTFCDWGSLTYDKIKKFDLQRVYDEIEWVGQRGLGFVYLADANFGIFPERDLAITNKIKEVRAQYGNPTGINLNWAKNQKSTVVDIAKTLMDSKFEHGMTISLQTLSENVLEIIKRKNLEINRAQELFQLCREKGVPINIEMILGLPGETLESWKSNFYKLFRLNQKTMSIYQCQPLENSELNISQMSEYEITTIQSQNSFINSSSQEEISEYLPSISATRDMPLDDMVLANLWMWFFFTFHINGLTNFVSEFCEREGVADYETFYQGLFDLISTDPVMSQELNTRKSQIHVWLSTGVDQSENVFNFTLEGSKLYTYGTSCKIHIDKQLKAHVQLLLSNYLDSLIANQDVKNDLIKFQETYLVDLHSIDSYPKTSVFNYDWLEYFVHKQNLKSKYTNIIFDNKVNAEMAKASTTGLLEYIWYKRRIGFGMASLNDADNPATLPYMV